MKKDDDDDSCPLVNDDDVDVDTSEFGVVEAVLFVATTVPFKPDLAVVLTVLLAEVDDVDFGCGVVLVYVVLFVVVGRASH